MIALRYVPLRRMICRIHALQKPSESIADVAQALNGSRQWVHAGNHEEESEFTFGDDYTQTTGCIYPGLQGGTGGDCARSFM